MTNTAEKHYKQRIHIEIGTPIMLDIQGTDIKVKSELIGIYGDEFLILSAPVGIAGIRQRLVNGQKVTLRYVYDAYIYGFETHVITLTDKPRPLLMIEYPVKTISRTRRQSARHDCFIQAKIQVDSNEHNGIIMDMSENGCRFMTPILSDQLLRRIDTDGIESQLHFTSPQDKNDYDIPVRIVNQHEYKSVSKLGIQFGELDEEMKEKMVKLYNYLDKS